MSKEEDKKLQEAFDDVFRYSLIMGLKFPWQMIAATLVTIGLRIYKTVLDEEGYEGMTNSIAENFDNIEKFEDTTLHQKGNMSNPYDKQVGGNHYQNMKIQPAEFINKNKLPFAEGNAIKYICRHINKGGEQDLKKAKHYIDMIIDRDYGDDAEQSKTFSGLSISYGDEGLPQDKTEDEITSIHYPSGATVENE